MASRILWEAIFCDKGSVIFFAGGVFLYPDSTSAGIVDKTNRIILLLYLSLGQSTFGIRMPVLKHGVLSLKNGDSAFSASRIY